MGYTAVFFLNSILLGVGLAMDAFSVSLANGLHEPDMPRGRQLFISGTYAFFQALMPLAGWIAIRTILDVFRFIQPFIPWIAFIVLSFIGGKMIAEALEERKKTAAEGTQVPAAAVRLSMGMLLAQGVATSIDALSVGFTISDYGFVMALVCALIIAAVTWIICLAGLAIGRKVGTKLSWRAGILGGVILILIGLEILISSFF